MLKKEININRHSDKLHKEIHGYNRHELTLGQKYADFITRLCGSWWFILSLLFLLVFWIVMNILVLIEGWDPYPFILLNLVLSCITAIQVPLILMSEVRHREVSMAKAERDYIVNRKAEREIENMQRDLHEIKRLLKK